MLTHPLLSPIAGLNRTKLIAILCAAFVLATFALPIHTAFAQSLDTEGPIPRFEAEPCDTFYPQGTTIDGEFKCGYLVVPERHSNIDDPVIRLAVVILSATDSDDPVAPLVILHGGPGGSAVADMDTLFSDHPVRQGRDIILVDQRGSGLSKPNMVCPEVVAFWYDHSEAEHNEEESPADDYWAYEACRDRLLGEGVDQSAYSTEESAADIEDLRTVLIDDKVNLYGVSYGAELAIAIMTLYPEGIRSVILDSGVPPHNDYDLSERMELEEIISACKRSAACERAYPNLAQKFEQTVERLNLEPVALKATHPETGKVADWSMDGDDFTSVVAELLRDSSIIRFIPMVIRDAANGNYSFVEIFIEILISIEGDNSWGANISIGCAPQVSYFTHGYIDTRSDSSIGDFDRENSRICQVWNENNLPTKGEATEKKDYRTVLPEIPTLILAGRFDLLVPPKYGEWIAEQLPHAISVTVESAGHGAISSSDCVDGLMADFLSQSQINADLTCLDTAAEMDFLTPEEILRLPLIEFVLGFLRRSPRFLLFAKVLGVSWLAVALASLRSLFSIGAAERRTDALARRW